MDAFGYRDQTHRLLKLVRRSKKSLLTGNRRGGSNLVQLTGEKRIFGEFRDEFAKLSAGYFWFLFAQGRHRQQNLRKRPQVVAVIGGDLELLDACFLVAVDSSEAEKKLLDSRQTSDDVIRRAQAKIGIRGVRRDYQKSFSVQIGFTDLSSGCRADCLSIRLA